MKIEEISKLIFTEILAAEKKFPGWPSDVVHAAAIVAEECRELVKAALDFYYGRGTKGVLRNEAVQTGAMVYRFMMNIEKYQSDVPLVSDIKKWEKEADTTDDSKRGS